MAADVLAKMQHFANVMYTKTGVRPRLLTVAPDVYDDLCAEIIEARMYNTMPSDRRVPFRVAGLDFLISEDEDAAPGHAYFLTSDGM
ncbi:MAG: hypothetical protein ACR652_24460 [Methylocystis sp.]|uniref:hypothetical protein n=1 Tax=Methylocystis sp. TaxID=1911079 RepID=UPI003DA46AF9